MLLGAKGATAGSLDGSVWRELKALLVAWYDGLARILTKVQEIGVWPDGLLDAYIAMIPEADGDATPLGQRPLSVLPVVHRICVLFVCFSWRIGFGRGSLILYSVLVVGVVLLKLGLPLLWISRWSFLSGIVESDVHLFVADVIKSFDTVDRGSLDRVLSSLGLPGLFRPAYF